MCCSALTAFCTVHQRACWFFCMLPAMCLRMFGLHRRCRADCWICQGVKSGLLTDGWLVKRPLLHALAHHHNGYNRATYLCSFSQFLLDKHSVQ